MNFSEYDANLHRHPCSYRTFRREECVGDVKQQQQQGELHARVPLFHSFANHEEALPQEGGLKGCVVDKKTACQGVTQWMRVREAPSAINTYSTSRPEPIGTSPNQQFKPQHHNSIKETVLIYARVLLWLKLLSSQQLFSLHKYGLVNELITDQRVKQGQMCFHRVWNIYSLNLGDISLGKV